MINLYDLTAHQVYLLDILWSIDTEEDVLAWTSTLSDTDRQQCESLMELLLLEELDNRLVASVKFPQANSIINKIKTL